MKKRLFLFVFVGLASMFAACSETGEADEESEKNKDKDPTGEEVYSKAVEVTEEMESVEASSYMKQTTSSADDDSILMETESDSDIHMMMDPLTMHMKTISSAAYEEITGDTPDTDTEMYLVDDEIYYNNEYSGDGDDWLKAEVDTVDAAEKIANQQFNPMEQIKLVQDYADDLTIEHIDDTYLLKLDMEGDDEEFNDFIKGMFEENMDGETDQKNLENMDINSVSVELSVDEETFNIKTFEVDLDMMVETDDGKNNIVQIMKSEYSNFNHIDSIEVPEDVKDEAIEQ